MTRIEKEKREREGEREGGREGGRRGGERERLHTHCQ
jgi:hypothetical protein